RCYCTTGQEQAVQRRGRTSTQSAYPPRLQNYDDGEQDYQDAECHDDYYRPGGRIALTEDVRDRRQIHVVVLAAGDEHVVDQDRSGRGEGATEVLLADLLSGFDVESVDPAGFGPEVDRAVLGDRCALDTAGGEGPEPLARLQIVGVGRVGSGAAHEYSAVGDRRGAGAIVARFGPGAQRVLPEHLTGVGVETEDSVLIDLLARFVGGAGRIGGGDNDPVRNGRGDVVQTGDDLVQLGGPGNSVRLGVVGVESIRGGGACAKVQHAVLDGG